MNIETLLVAASTLAAETPMARYYTVESQDGNSIALRDDDRQVCERFLADHRAKYPEGLFAAYVVAEHTRRNHYVSALLDLCEAIRYQQGKLAQWSNVCDSFASVESAVAHLREATNARYAALESGDEAAMAASRSSTRQAWAGISQALQQFQTARSHVQST